MNRTQLSLSALGLGLVLFFAVNILASSRLRARLDLTEEGLFSLTQGTRNILADVDEPIHLYYYFSEKAAVGQAQVQTYATRVREMLEEYQAASDGKVRLEVIDPEPFSEDEERAVQAGIVSLGGAEPIYLGLVARNSVGDQEVIPFFNPSKESFLEYDLTNLVYGLNLGERPKLGLLCSLPIDGTPGAPTGNPMQPMQGGTPPWQLLAQLERLYEIERIDSFAQTIPDSLSVLVLIHPKQVPETTQYAIDQYVMRGGHLLVFVDPYCRADPPQQDPENPALMPQNGSSNLEKLFGAWGFELVPSVVAADRRLATQIEASGRRGQPKAMDYVVWLTLDQKECFASDEATTGQLGMMLLPTAGVLRPREGATTELTPLLTTTEESARIQVSMQTLENPQVLLTTFFPEGEKLTLAARVTGPTKSAFPAGPPEGWGPVDGETEDEAGHEHLAESSQPIHVIAVADVDFLNDPWWIREEQFMGLSLGYRKTSENGDFALNAVEQLAGNSDLIGIRGRGLSTRPFGRVEEIRREAEDRLLGEQQALETKLRELERKLVDLQGSDPGQSAFLLSPKQEAELERFRQEELQTRRQLRDLQHRMQKDIEGLGFRLNLLASLGVPALVAILSAGFGLSLVRRRRAASRGGAR